jgi:hypothetical protein
VETESFALEMKDLVSKPADDVAKSLKRMKTEMAAAEKETAKAAKEHSKEMAQEAKESKALGKDILGLAGNFGALGAIVGAAAGGTAAVVQELISVAKEAAFTIADWVKQGIEWAIEGQAFQRKMTDVFTIFRGTAEKGRETYEMVKAIGSRVPIDQEKAADTAQELLSLGLKGQNRLGNTIQAIGDMQAAMGDQAAGKLKSIISTAQESTHGGRFRGIFAPSRQELQSIGISYDELSHVLANKLGKTNAEAKRMLMYGQISAQQGIDALDDAVAGGNIGKAAKDALLDPTNIMKAFRDNIKNLFTVDTPEAKEFMKEVRGFVDSLGPGSEQAHTLGDRIKELVTEGFKKGTELLKDFEHYLIRAEIAGLDLDTSLAPLKKSLGELGENQTAIQLVGAAMWQLGVAGKLAEFELGLAADEMKRLIDFANDLDKFVHTGSKDAGVGVGQGLLEGIGEMTGGVSKAALDMGAAAIGSLKDGVDAHSPSLAAMDIGGDVGIGFKMGAAKEGVGLGDMRLTAPDIQPQGGGGMVQVTVDVGGIHVGGGASNAAEIGRLLEPEVTSLFQRLREELASVAT